MNKYKTALFMNLFALFAFVIMTGCNTEKKASTLADIDGDTGETRISVITSYGGDDGNRQNYEKAVKAYEASFGYLVDDNSGISNEEWKANIISSFDSGEEPDVLFFFTGADANEIISKNSVVSLEEIRSVYPDYASNMEERLIPVSPYDGKAYAVPVNGYWEGLYVNKKILEECGVEIPDKNTTWEEFLEGCRMIADKGYVPITTSLNEVPHYLFEYCILNNIKDSEHLVNPAAIGDDVSKNWAAGLDDIMELYKSGFLPENTNEITAVEADAIMSNGKAAYMIEGSWKMGWFAENVANVNDFTVTYVPGKGERQTTDIIGGISMGYYITRKAWENPEKQAACVEFVQSMTSDEVVPTFGVTAVTALKNNTELPEGAGNLIRDAYEMTRGFTNLKSSIGDGIPPNQRSVLFGDISKVVKGEITAEEAVNNSFFSN